MFYLMMAVAVIAFGACSPDESNEPGTPGIETPENPEEPGARRARRGSGFSKWGDQDTGCLFQLGRHDTAYGSGDCPSDRSRSVPN